MQSFTHVAGALSGVAAGVIRCLASAPHVPGSHGAEPSAGSAARGARPADSLPLAFAQIPAGAGGAGPPAASPGAAEAHLRQNSSPEDVATPDFSFVSPQKQPPAGQEGGASPPWAGLPPLNVPGRARPQGDDLPRSAPSTRPATPTTTGKQSAPLARKTSLEGGDSAPSSGASTPTAATAPPAAPAPAPKARPADPYRTSMALVFKALRLLEVGDAAAALPLALAALRRAAAAAARSRTTLRPHRAAALLRLLRAVVTADFVSCSNPPKLDTLKGLTRVLASLDDLHLFARLRFDAAADAGLADDASALLGALQVTAAHLVHDVRTAPLASLTSLMVAAANCSEHDARYTRVYAAAAGELGRRVEHGFEAGWGLPGAAAALRVVAEQYEDALTWVGGEEERDALRLGLPRGVWAWLRAAVGGEAWAPRRAAGLLLQLSAFLKEENHAGRVELCELSDEGLAQAAEDLTEAARYAAARAPACGARGAGEEQEQEATPWLRVQMEALLRNLLLCVDGERSRRAQAVDAAAMRQAAAAEVAQVRLQAERLRLELAAASAALAAAQKAAEKAAEKKEEEDAALDASALEPEKALAAGRAVVQRAGAAAPALSAAPASAWRIASALRRPFQAAASAAGALKSAWAAARQVAAPVQLARRAAAAAGASLAQQAASVLAAAFCAYVCAVAACLLVFGWVPGDAPRCAVKALPASGTRSRSCE